MKKYFLITGTSSGIGNTIAKNLLKKKFNVCGVSRSKKNIFHNNYHYIQGDITQIPDIEKIYKFLKNKNIKLDGLVNNAGKNIPNKFDKISREDYDNVLDVNIKSPFFLTQKMIPIFKKRASIVNISSFSSISGGPYSSHYAISKSGIETLTKNLSIFFSKKKIRVNAISPGLIRTRLAKNFRKHPYFDRILLNRIGETKEIADVVDFLLSENSSYINGQVLNVDGGMFLK
jgi:NAD(P)-dependent dehydrogenase (short-subunit alcohol dehydrogenase family)